MKTGWIKIYRRLQDNPLWGIKPFSKGQAWVDLLLRANHKEGNFVMIGNAKISILPGQILTSGKLLANVWGWSQHKVTNFQSNLFVNGQIGKPERKSKYTLITIINWSIYQSQQTEKETKKEIKRKSKGNEKETIKKEKNKKKLKKVRIKEDNIVANQNHLRLVSLLKTLILQNDPKAKITNDLIKWIDPIDKLERIDGRTLIEIEGVIRFSQDNDFWKSNILSTRNLRKHFPQLILQAKKGGFIVTPRPEPKPENPEEKAKREKREKEEKEARYQEGLKKWRGMSLEELRKHQVNLRKWGKIAKIPPVEVEKDLAEIIKEKEENEQK